MSVATREILKAPLIFVHAYISWTLLKVQGPYCAKGFKQSDNMLLLLSVNFWIRFSQSLIVRCRLLCVSFQDSKKRFHGLPWPSHKCEAFLEFSSCRTCHNPYDRNANKKQLSSHRSEEAEKPVSSEVLPLSRNSPPPPHVITTTRNRPPSKVMFFLPRARGMEVLPTSEVKSPIARPASETGRLGVDRRGGERCRSLV